MARQNPYQMDPFLAQGFSSLTKALIGDAETDYQVARTGYANAQTNEINELLPFKKDQYTADIGRLNATAGAQGALAGKYGAETNKTNLESEALSARAAALAALKADPAMGSIINSMFNVPDGATINPATLGELAYLSFAEGNANDITQALANIGEGQDTNIARDTVLDSTQPIGERIIANAMLGNAPNENSNPDFAQTKLDATLQNNLDVQDLENQGATGVANIEATSREKIAEMDNTAQTAWEEYAADRKKEADIRVQELQNTQSGKEAAAKLKAEIQWESENNIIVEDGVMVFSPDAAKKYGVTNQVNVGTDENPEMMFSIDVSRDNKNGVAVTIEGTDQTIYLDQQYFDKFNVVNKGGKFVIPEGAVNPPSGSKGNPPSVNNTNANSYNELLNIAIDEGGVELPPQMKQEILAEASKAQQENNSVIAGQNVINQKLEPIMIEDGWTSDIITYPAIIDKIDEILQVVPEANRPAAAIEALQNEFRYSADAAQKIYQYMLRR
jgi:hypothetical protein